MNSKVGIFWFVENTLVYKAQNAIDLKADQLGFIDSPLQHQVEWEENNIYQLFGLTLFNSDYYNFPRGRVIFNTKLNTSYVYLDKKSFKKHIVNEIKVKFFWRIQTSSSLQILITIALLAFSKS
jgi:hypothetical protein